MARAAAEDVEGSAIKDAKNIACKVSSAVDMKKSVWDLKTSAREAKSGAGYLK